MTKYTGKHFSEYRLPSFNLLVERIKLSVIVKHTTLGFTWITKKQIKEKTFLVFEDYIKYHANFNHELTDYEKQYIIEREKEHYDL